MPREIFELGRPTPPTGRTRYRQWLAHHSSEIARSLDTMRDVEFYIGKFPYRKTKIAKHRHLQFHVEAFLHELYIMQERLRFSRHTLEPRPTYDASLLRSNQFRQMSGILTRSRI